MCDGACMYEEGYNKSGTINSTQKDDQCMRSGTCVKNDITWHEVALQDSLAKIRKPGREQYACAQVTEPECTRGCGGRDPRAN